MANPSVNHLLVLINRQIKIQEHLIENLSRLEAMSEIDLSEGPQPTDRFILHDYLTVLRSLVVQTRKKTEDNVSELFEVEEVIKKKS